MKNTSLRITAFLLAFLMLPLFAFAEGTAEYTLEAKTFPCRQCLDDAKEPVESEMTLYFVNGGDISYVKLSEMWVLSGACSKIWIKAISISSSPRLCSCRTFSA